MRKLIIIFLLLFIPIAGSAKQSLAYGPTTSSDELWQIAISVRPNSSVSIEQTMLAILKANPDAFIDNNAYKLKPGYVLSIPDIEAIKVLSVKVAAQQIEEQHKAFLGIKKNPKTDKKEVANKKELRSQKSEENTIEKIKQAVIENAAQYQERLEIMEKHNQELETELEELNTSISALKQEILKVHKENIEQHKSIVLTWFLYPYTQYLYNFFGILGLKLLAGLVLMLIIWWSYLNYKQNKIQKNLRSQQNYDFMNGEEGANAKLDLAQAYIDMDDKESARKVIAEILEYGNDKQKKAAKELLKK